MFETTHQMTGWWLNSLKNIKVSVRLPEACLLRTGTKGYSFAAVPSLCFVWCWIFYLEAIHITWLVVSTPLKNISQLG